MYRYCLTELVECASYGRTNDRMRQSGTVYRPVWWSCVPRGIPLTWSCESRGIPLGIQELCSKGYTARYTGVVYQGVYRSV